MKNKVILLMVIALVLAPNFVLAKEWTIGNSDINSTTSVGGIGGSSLSTNSTAQMFRDTKKEGYSFGCRTDNSGNCTYFISAGPYSYSASKKDVKIGKSYTFLKVTGTFVLGPVPVTVGGSVGASFSFSVSNGTKVSIGAAGTGSAQAGIGLDGWGGGVKAVLFPLFGGTLSADFAARNATFKLDALKVYIKLYVEYLWGVGSHEHTVADYGPLWSSTYRIW